MEWECDWKWAKKNRERKARERRKIEWNQERFIPVHPLISPLSKEHILYTNDFAICFPRNIISSSQVFEGAHQGINLIEGILYKVRFNDLIQHESIRDCIRHVTLRMCIGFQAFNNNMVRYQYPTSYLDDMILGFICSCMPITEIVRVDVIIVTLE